MIDYCVSPVITNDTYISLEVGIALIHIKSDNIDGFSVTCPDVHQHQADISQSPAITMWSTVPKYVRYSNNMLLLVQHLVLPKIVELRTDVHR